ncbi:MAG TPA: matrixin family metalloprotease [Thermoanaerobaculia bacterium]|nr:matrixin family metalloprotease [Thermoanaerobaculia bacterium]
MRKTFVRRPVLLAAVGLVLAGTASAYVLLSPARTWDSAPNYIVDNRGLTGVADSDGGATAVVNALNNSSVGWNSAGSGTVIAASKGSVSGFSLGDGVPMLNFRDPQGACTGNCLAATFTGYYQSRGNGTYRIYDADIVTNTTHAWTSQSEDPGGSGCSGEFYIEGVQVHEAGHGIGLGHTTVSGATMYPSVSACNNAPASIATDDANGINALYGGGGGGGGAPCTGCDHYTGTLSGTGDYDFHPNGTYYFSGSGTHRGWLAGPSGTDFDLRLQKWNGSSWVTVASSLSSSSTESITYNGTSGYYVWRINSYSGSGSYDFWLDRP